MWTRIIDDVSKKKNWQKGELEKAYDHEKLVRDFNNRFKNRD